MKGRHPLELWVCVRERGLSLERGREAFQDLVEEVPVHVDQVSPIFPSFVLTRRRAMNSVSFSHCPPVLNRQASRPCSSPATRPGQRRPFQLARPRAENETHATTEPKKAVEDPVWVRREKAQRLIEAEGGADLPFGVYLIASALVAIAAVGSIYEFTAKHAIFGVIPPDSPLWLPILGTFAVTGLPSAGYLFYKAVSSANKESERQDKLDGF